ncbi:hypothetical protein B5807_10706 [Epicoccum nigrum]|uniref:F-box domain-containing protein n=1 Tax=Epicoccum nigrum TaxID=105696 RepID=A0A1Y2LN55_EPING|nr:hypothetical protein B5807_10706 [Epicoccum nigrum]
MASASADPPKGDHGITETTGLPPWLANHLNIEWNQDDVDALLTSIDASQDATAPTSHSLPAELLLLIIEYIPVGYLLDIRLVCRGFRDAIDGRILYHHLQRTRLVGYLGSRNNTTMGTMSDEAYEDLHLLYADFKCLEDEGSDEASETRQTVRRALWSNTYAKFTSGLQWKEAHQLHASREEIPSSLNLLSSLQLSRNHQAYGTLTWAIQLDSCVLDLDLPLAVGRQNFGISIDPDWNMLRVEWKPMLFCFLKTERALRLLMEEKREEAFTFSHTEDCLRAIRRQRLHAALNLENKIDRHIKWSLRLLRPLWGIGGPRDPSTLDPVERDAVRFLLLQRRAAAMSVQEIAHLNQLAEDYEGLVNMVKTFGGYAKTLQSHLVRRTDQDMMYEEVAQEVLDYHRIPINPIVWPEKLREDIEVRVRKGKAQKHILERMQALMSDSMEALVPPEYVFDAMDSDF